MESEIYTWHLGMWSFYSQLSEPELKPKLIIQYYGKCSETLKQTFKTLGYETIFKSSSTLGSKISNNKKNKIEKMDQKGVYSITCGECNSTYIGKTEHEFIHTHLGILKNL